ncbi:MAG: ATP-binding protein [Bacteroidota bacterium]|jgi:Putative DNA-binding domain
MKISPVEPGLLDLAMRDKDFALFYQNKQLLSPGGNEIRSENQRVLKQLMMEACFKNSISDEEFSVYTLLSVITDFMDKEKDPFLENFNEVASYDPILKLREGCLKASEINNAPGFHALLENEPVLLNMMFFGMDSLLEAFARFTLDMRETIFAGMEIPAWKDFLMQSYINLPSYKKAVVNLLSFTHHSAVVLPMLIAGNYITGIEYVNGLPAIHLRETSEVSSSPFTVHGSRITVHGFRETVLAVLDNVRDAVGFLSCYSNTGKEGLNYLISKGEGNDLEFKSTLRWDLRAGKTNQAVERACLKSISAFLNSNGGLLLIGVRDDGSIEGIESDRFPNTDKFLLHLWTLVRTSFGTDVSSYIHTELETAEGKTVCTVKCSRSGRPVFLRQPGFPEEFYIRVGPGTIALAVSEALKYIADHFTEN